MSDSNNNKTKENTFKISDIVALKSHPEESDFAKNIKTQFPPLLLVKEVVFENKKKKIFSDEIESAIIADKVKYVCVYFDEKKSDFVEVQLYHAYLESYKDEAENTKSQINNEAKNTKNQNNNESENSAEKVPEADRLGYKFGKTVILKTFELENEKKAKINARDKNGYIYRDRYMTFCSPNFVLTGVKREISDGLFYYDGKPKRKISKIFFKVMWFNHYQNKFSEKYLPHEFFIEPLDL